MGLPGEIFFQVDSLLADGTVVKVRGSAAKEAAFVDADTLLSPAK
jgi:hypothetical protein